jgi:fatty-acyl-CoA synthase
VNRRLKGTGNRIMAVSRQSSDDKSVSTNYTVHLLEKLAETGDRDAVVQGRRRISGRESRSLILRFAEALANNGVGEGDGIALFIANSPEALLLKLAVHFIGARLVFVPPEPGNPELEAFIAQADVKMLIFDPALGDRPARMAGAVQVPSVFSLGPCDGVPDFLDVVGEQTGWGPADAGNGAAVCTLFYTGGTTGRPKLVTHDAGFYQRVIATAAIQASKAPDPRLLVCTLITHMSGHFASLMRLAGGAAVVMMHDFDAGAALSVLAEQKITEMILVPPMLYEMLDHPDWPPAGFPDVENIFYTGSPTAPSRLRQAIGKFGPVMHQVYATTEHGMIAELWPGQHDLSRPHLLESCGKPVPSVEVELREGNGQVTGAGQVGEVWARSGMVTTGYWQDPEASRDLLEDGWARTGDLAYRDDAGYLYLVDRARDVIVTGPTSGNVYSRLLDDFLSRLPGISQAAAVGVPDAQWGEAVHGFLVPDGGRRPDLGEIRRLVAEVLGDLYMPKSVSVVARLPYTTLDKIDKKALRAAYVAEAENGIADDGAGRRG